MRTQNCQYQTRKISSPTCIPAFPLEKKGNFDAIQTIKIAHLELLNQNITAIHFYIMAENIILNSEVGKISISTHQRCDA